jgi:hypothetical protein
MHRARPARLQDALSSDRVVGVRERPRTTSHEVARFGPTSPARLSSTGQHNDALEQRVRSSTVVAGDHGLVRACPQKSPPPQAHSGPLDPRLEEDSSTSRYRPNRKYQRTVRTITSGGNPEPGEGRTRD